MKQSFCQRLQANSDPGDNTSCCCSFFYVLQPKPVCFFPVDYYCSTHRTVGTCMCLLARACPQLEIDLCCFQMGHSNSCWEYGSCAEAHTASYWSRMSQRIYNLGSNIFIYIKNAGFDLKVVACQNFFSFSFCRLLVILSTDQPWCYV